MVLLLLELVMRLASSRTKVDRAMLALVLCAVPPQQPVVASTRLCWLWHHLACVLYVEEVRLRKRRRRGAAGGTEHQAWAWVYNRLCIYLNDSVGGVVPELGLLQGRPVGCCCVPCSACTAAVLHAAWRCAKTIDLTCLSGKARAGALPGCMQHVGSSGLGSDTTV